MVYVVNGMVDFVEVFGDRHASCAVSMDITWRFILNKQFVSLWQKMCCMLFRALTIFLVLCENGIVTGMALWQELHSQE